MNNIWENYKINNINNLLFKVRDIVDNLDNNIQISAAVKTDPLLSKKKWSQDWRFWLTEELVDFVVVMNYIPDIIDFHDAIESIKADIDKELFNRILIGISIYNQSAESVSDKILDAYLHKFKGVSLFSYDNRKNDLLWYNDLLDVFNMID